MTNSPHAQNFIDLLYEGNYEAMVSYAIDREFERWDFEPGDAGDWYYLVAWTAWYAHREGVKGAKDDLERMFNEGYEAGWDACEEENKEEDEDEE